MDKENFHFYVEIKRGQQQKILEEIFLLMDKYKEDRKGYVSLVGTQEELIEVIRE